MVPAQDDDRSHHGEFLQCVDAAGHILVCRPDHVEQVTGVDDQVRSVLAGVGEDLSDDGVVVLGTRGVLGGAAQVPIDT
jgi:hypothetical protein